jgi:hypothetical protein
MMTALRVAAVFTLIALGLMVWSMIVPTPLPIMLAMSVGQGLGVIAFALYGYVVLRTLEREVRQRAIDRRARTGEIDTIRTTGELPPVKADTAAKADQAKKTEEPT